MFQLAKSVCASDSHASFLAWACCQALMESVSTDVSTKRLDVEWMQRTEAACNMSSQEIELF